MALLFGLGYAGIIFEESLAFNKSGVGLLMAVSLWVIRSIGVSHRSYQYRSFCISDSSFSQKKKKKKISYISCPKVWNVVM